MGPGVPGWRVPGRVTLALMLRVQNLAARARAQDQWAHLVCVASHRLERAGTPLGLVPQLLCGDDNGAYFRGVMKGASTTRVSTHGHIITNLPILRCNSRTCLVSLTGFK